jgi:hypothetical protein
MTMVMQARPTQGRRQGNRLWVFLPLALAFAIIAGIAIYGVLSPSKATPAPAAPGFRGSLVWGDGIFSNKAQLKAWLTLHGASYKVWVREHPAALRLVRPPVKHHKAVTKPKHKPPAHASASVPSSKAATGTSRSSHRGGGLIWLAVFAGLLLGGLAAIPRRIIERAGFLDAVGDRELRVGALGAGAAILLGVIVATLAA